MEAAEGFHGEDIQNRFRLAAYQDLVETGCVVDPTLLAGNGRVFNATARIDWIEGYDLLQREPCWVPAETVHTDYTVGGRPDSACLLRGSNGLSSGNHPLEAISSAICEAVERDAAAVWSARGLRARALCHVDQSSIDDLDCRSLLTRYEQAGVAVRLWNVSSDVDIATFVCDIRKESDDPRLGMRRFRGAGCHPNRAVALGRALTEAAQTRLTYIVGSRDDLSPADYERPMNVDVGEALLNVLQRSSEACSYHDVPSFDSDDLAADVRWELDRLRSIGIDRVVVVDLTRPEFGIPAVRVVIPGLEGDTRNPEYQPGMRAHAARGHAGAPSVAVVTEQRRSPAGLRVAAAALPAVRRSAELEGLAVIFAGPSLPPTARPPASGLVWRPPARQGDLYRAASQGAVVIGLIDGYFDAVPSVWHKEILWAMKQGAHVYGAASIGALRAAELAVFGMKGVGCIYEMYRDGTLIDDDEVALQHGHEEVGFVPVTEAMVNIRATVRQAVVGGSLEERGANALIAAAKRIFYQDRTWRAVLAIAASLESRVGARRASFTQALDQRVNQKALDARVMVDAVRRHLALGTERLVVDYKMADTAMWHAAHGHTSAAGG
jgi:ribosomal protein S12 methylthiotransferase accessory factor